MSSTVNQALSAAGQKISIEASLVSSEVGASPDANGTAPSPAPSSKAGNIQITAHAPNGDRFVIRFTPPVGVNKGASNFNLTAPNAQYAFDGADPSAVFAQRADVTTTWLDSTYQELGLLGLPTPLDFTKDPTAIPDPPITTAPIKFTLHITTSSDKPQANVPVSLAAQSQLTDTGSLATVLQAAIDQALFDYGRAAGLTAGDVTVCRVDHAAAPGTAAACQGSGNELDLLGKPGKVTTLLIDVPYLVKTSDGETPVVNGAITELGFTTTNAPPSLLAITLSSLDLHVGTTDFGATIGGTGSTVTFALLTQGGRQWTALEAKNLSGSVTLGALASASLSGVSITLNTYGGSADGALNWATLGAQSPIDLTDEVPFAIAGNLDSLNIANLVTGHAKFAYSKRLVTTPVKGTLMTLSLTNVYLAVGTTSIGVIVTGDSLAFAALSDSSSAARWIGLNATGFGANLTVPGVVADVSNLMLQVNKAEGTTTALNWNDVVQAPGALKSLPVDVGFIKVEGDLNNLSIAGLLTGSAHFT